MLRDPLHVRTHGGEQGKGVVHYRAFSLRNVVLSGQGGNPGIGGIYELGPGHVGKSRGKRVLRIFGAVAGGESG